MALSVAPTAKTKAIVISSVGGCLSGYARSVMGDMEKRYILACKQCGEEFESGNHQKMICDSCREKNKRFQQERQRVANEKPTMKPAKPRPTADIELMQMVRILDRYNERNGTHYSYGKFMQLIADKKIDWRKEIKNA